MILVKLMGGLGNQMFQYAAALRLAEKHHTALGLDVRGYAAMAEIDTPRQYELDVFNISGSVATDKELELVVSSEQQSELGRRLRHKLGLGSDIFTYGEANASFQPATLTLPDNIYLLGWWQNENYFKDVRAKLLEQFTPKKPLSASSTAYLKTIDSYDNCVSLHVRRGDYVNNPHANAHHGTTSLDYYTAAVTYLNERGDRPRFVVFSDDIEWCKKNLHLDKDSMFVAGNQGATAYEDLVLMSRCRHNIIANSSFSWWGAWLNNTPDKIVVAPQVWFQNEEANNETEIVPDDWIRL